MYLPYIVLVQGMKRVFDDMPDICLDVPAAYTLLEQLGGQLYQHGCLTDTLYKDMPARWVDMGSGISFHGTNTRARTQFESLEFRLF